MKQHRTQLEVDEEEHNSLQVVHFKNCSAPRRTHQVGDLVRQVDVDGVLIQREDHRSDDTRLRGEGGLEDFIVPGDPDAAKELKLRLSNLRNFIETKVIPVRFAQ